MEINKRIGVKIWENYELVAEYIKNNLLRR